METEQVPPPGDTQEKPTTATAETGETQETKKAVDKGTTPESAPEETKEEPATIAPTAKKAEEITKEKAKEEILPQGGPSEEVPKKETKEAPAPAEETSVKENKAATAAVEEAGRSKAVSSDTPKSQAVGPDAKENGKEITPIEHTLIDDGCQTVERKIRPRKRSSSIDPKVGVDLAFGKGKLQDLDPITVGQLFKRTVKRIPKGVALRFIADGLWRNITYEKYYELVVRAAKSFIKLGVEDYGGVCIIGFNSPEWVIANLGAMFAGALPAGIYTTNGPEACWYVADSCKASVIVVEDNKQLEKILEIRDRLPYLKAIVQYKGHLNRAYDNIYEWESFVRLGDKMDNSIIEQKVENQKPEQCALLIYTSGTTGKPKAVMLSHDNLTWTANCLCEAYGKLEFGAEHTVSYLPLSHMAAQMADIYLTLTIGGTVHFAQPDALKGGLPAILKEAQPTIFFGVPRVYEKFMEGIQEKSSGIKGLKKKVGQWANKRGIKGNYRRQSSLGSMPHHHPRGSFVWSFHSLGSMPHTHGSFSSSLKWSLAEKLVFNKVKEALGFQRCKIFVVGSAPTRQDVHEFFMSYDMPLMELYGMSESSGPQTFNVDTFEGKWRTGSCGPLVPGAHLKIANPNKDGEGEICYYGRHVFMGYLNDAEKTKEAIDEDGWLHSGDVGKVDKDGFLYITGRIKELLITSGGENIAPVPIESTIKSELPFLSNVFLVGDKKKYLTCLVTLQTEMDMETGEPKDQLTAHAKQLLEQLGSNSTTVSEVLGTHDPAVNEAIRDGIQRANKHAISNAQRVQKFSILPKDFSIAGGELGPTMKVRRSVVLDKYSSTIDNMYTVTYYYAVRKSIS